METINKAAYWDYQRERVYVKSANKVHAPPPADFDAPLQAEAKRHDRIPGPFVLSDLQIEKDLWPRQEKQDRHRPSIYEAWNKAMDYALRHTSVPMPIVWKHLQPVGLPLDRREIRSRSHRVRNVPEYRASAPANAR